MKSLLQPAPISTQTDTDPGPDWRARAACLGHDPETFFPQPADREGETEAIAICSGCPVKADCLADAMQAEKGLSVSNRWGIWGGFSAHERARMDRENRDEGVA